MGIVLQAGNFADLRVGGASGVPGLAPSQHLGSRLLGEWVGSYLGKAGVFSGCSAGSHGAMGADSSLAVTPTRPCTLAQLALPGERRGWWPGPVLASGLCPHRAWWPLAGESPDLLDPLNLDP